MASREFTGSSVTSLGGSAVSGDEDDEDFTGMVGRYDYLNVDIEEEKKRHRAFFSNCQLSLSIAIACTLFGIPTYSPHARVTIFGHKECGPTDIWFRYRHPNKTLTEWEESMGKDNAVWCGYLTSNYNSAWPKLITMIVFTAFQNTGTTVKKAWQGVIGTAMAVLNIFFMDTLFPGETVTWVAWLDTFAFIFLVLLSGSAENTMKFALSAHVFFMMTFLNPNKSSPKGAIPTGIPHIYWDQYTVGILSVAASGCAIAIFATVFPSMLLNYKSVESDAESTQKTMSLIWKEAIEYFCGSHRYLKRFVVAEAITGLNQTIDGIQSNLAHSWWETFDLGGFGKKRALYHIYDSSLQKMAKQMIALQDCVVNVEFGKGHREFCDAAKESMEALREAASHLLARCQEACKDGVIDSDEVEEIEEGVLHVKACQAKLLKVLQTVAGATHLHQIEFCFILSVWARRIVDCAESMLVSDQQEVPGFLQGVWHGFSKTWQLPSWTKLRWAARNFIPIAVSFVFGYQLPCWGEDAYQAEQVGGTKTCSRMHYTSSLFTPFDANMANTLSLLINNYPGAALINNIQRLLGVVMGKVIPMVIHGALFVADVHGERKSIALAVSLFIFAWGTNYMYYSSKRWALVGRLMAGFGCALLSRPMAEDTLEDYNPAYKELAQVVIGICFQMTVDMIFDLLQGESPRDSAVKKVSEVQGCLKRGFQAFFSADLDGLLEASKSAKESIAAAHILSQEVDPNMQLTPGYRADFKVDLYRNTLKQLELLYSDLMMLTLATRAWKADGMQHVTDKFTSEGSDSESDLEDSAGAPFSTPGFLTSLDSVVGKGGLKEELLHYIELVLDSLVAMLSHSAEDNKFQPAAKTRELVSLKRSGFGRLHELYTEIGDNKVCQVSGEESVCEDPHSKIAMAVRALVRSKACIGEILALMVPHIYLQN